MREDLALVQREYEDVAHESSDIFVPEKDEFDEVPKSGDRTPNSKRKT